MALGGGAKPVRRDELVLSYYALAVSRARRYRRARNQLDDLVQVACIGLMKAAERFDPELGTAFSTYATKTIDGELKRYFRDRTWTIRPPRSIRDVHGDVSREFELLGQEWGRSPTVAEVATRLGASEETVRLASNARELLSPLPLDAPMPASASTYQRREVAADRATVPDVEERLDLERLLATLDGTDRRILRMRFGLDMTQREIAERLGCSQMHVSRRIQASLAALRELLAGGDGTGAAAPAAS